MRHFSLHQSVGLAINHATSMAKNQHTLCGIHEKIEYFHKAVGLIETWNKEIATAV